MSHSGPSLIQTKDGLSIAKFSGRTYRFGRFVHPETRRRFDQFKAQWLLNERKVTDEMLRELRGRGRPDELTIDRMVDRFLDHLDRKHADEWKKNNYDRMRVALQPLRTLCGTEAASAFGPKKLQAVREFMVRRGQNPRAVGPPRRSGRALRPLHRRLPRCPPATSDRRSSTRPVWDPRLAKSPKKCSNTCRRCPARRSRCGLRSRFGCRRASRSKSGAWSARTRSR